MTLSRRASGALLESPRNPLAARLRRLERDRAARDREGLFFAWGLHLAREALAAGAPLRQAIIGPALDATPEGRGIHRDLHRAGVEIAAASRRVLESIATGSGDQGVLLLVERRASAGATLLAAGANLAVVAHGVQDPGNLGSILRSAWAFGADAVLALEGCADPFGTRVLRSAMGAHFRMRVGAASTAAALEEAEGRGLAIVAADPAGPVAPPAVDLRGPIALCLGNEGAGLPAELLRRARHRVRVPMRPEVDSLNVHAAAVALLYETWRQREGGRV